MFQGPFNTVSFILNCDRHDHANTVDQGQFVHSIVSLRSLLKGHIG